VLLTELEGNGSQDVTGVAQALTRRVAGCDLLVVCSPTYKATYTGLLKAFADGFESGLLVGKVAVPLMLYGDPRHAMAADVHLRPLLIELGASCPTAAVTLLDGNGLEIDGLQYVEVFKTEPNNLMEIETAMKLAWCMRINSVHRGFLVTLGNFKQNTRSFCFMHVISCINGDQLLAMCKEVQRGGAVPDIVK
jgi:hypothetical protein